MTEEQLEAQLEQGTYIEGNAYGPRQLEEQACAQEGKVEAVPDATDGLTTALSGYERLPRHRRRGEPFVAWQPAFVAESVDGLSRSDAVSSQRTVQSSPDCPPSPAAFRPGNGQMTASAQR